VGMILVTASLVMVATRTLTQRRQQNA